MATNAATYGNWLNTMEGAETTLKGAADTFAPGGSYGMGQLATIQTQGQQAQASALSNLVSTGMSSGTNALGSKARISSDMTKAKLSVADERSKMYANVLSQLAGLKQNMAGGQLGWAQLNQSKDLATKEMDLQKWLTTTNNAAAMNRSPSWANEQDKPNPNAWGTYGNSSPDMTDQWGRSPSGTSGGTGMSPNL